MMFMQSKAVRPGLLLFAAALALIATPKKSYAQTDEIQVYDAEIAEPGVVNLMWHQNFTPDGVKTPAFPGAIISDKSYNGVPEFAFGITPWFEQGLYIPVYSISKGRGLDPGQRQTTRAFRPAACSRPHLFLRREFRIQL
jgi:hypothetical protein